MTRPCVRPQAWKIFGKCSRDSEWEWKCACAQRSALGPYVSCHEEEGRRKLGSRVDQAHNIRTLSITSLHRRPIRKMKNTEKADRGAEFEISERVRSWETEERKEELILFFLFFLRECRFVNRLAVGRISQWENGGAMRCPAVIENWTRM